MTGQVFDSKESGSFYVLRQRLTADLIDRGLRKDPSDRFFIKILGEIFNVIAMKDPYILVVGDKEAAENTVSVNFRGSNKQQQGVPLDKFVEVCRGLNSNRTLELPQEF